MIENLMNKRLSTRGAERSRPSHDDHVQRPIQGMDVGCVLLLNELLLVMVQKVRLNPSSFTCNKLLADQHDALIFHDIIVSNVLQKKSSVQFLAMQRVNVLWNSLVTLLSHHNSLILEEQMAELVEATASRETVGAKYATIFDQSPIHVRTTLTLISLIFDLLHDELARTGGTKRSIREFLEILSPLFFSKSFLGADLPMLARLLTAACLSPVARELKITLATRAAIPPPPPSPTLADLLGLGVVVATEFIHDCGPISLQEFPIHNWARPVILDLATRAATWSRPLSPTLTLTLDHLEPAEEAKTDSTDKILMRALSRIRTHVGALPLHGLYSIPKIDNHHSPSPIRPRKSEHFNTPEVIAEIQHAPCLLEPPSLSPPPVTFETTSSIIMEETIASDSDRQDKSILSETFHFQIRETHFEKVLDSVNTMSAKLPASTQSLAPAASSKLRPMTNAPAQKIAQPLNELQSQGVGTVATNFSPRVEELDNTSLLIVDNPPRQLSSTKVNFDASKTPLNVPVSSSCRDGDGLAHRLRCGGTASVQPCDSTSFSCSSTPKLDMLGLALARAYIPRPPFFSSTPVFNCFTYLESPIKSKTTFAVKFEGRVWRLSSRGSWLSRYLVLRHGGPAHSSPDAAVHVGQNQDLWLYLNSHAVESAWGVLPCKLKTAIPIDAINTISSPSSSRGRSCRHFSISFRPGVGCASEVQWDLKCGTVNERIEWVKILETSILL